LRGAEGTASSGFRLVEDAVRDDYNDYNDYDCLVVSAPLLLTDRINLTFWRRHFILTVTVPRLFFTTLNAVSKPVFLNPRAAARYRALASSIPGSERPEETTICYKISLVQ